MFVSEPVNVARRPIPPGLAFAIAKLPTAKVHAPKPIQKPAPIEEASPMIDAIQKYIDSLP